MAIVYSASVFLMLVCATITMASSPHQKCPADLGTPTDVRVSDCTQSPCILKKGTNVTIEVDFTATADVQTVKDAVYGIISGMHVPFPTSQPDACKGKGLTCPLKKNQKYTYKSDIPISKIYPDIQLVVEYSIKNEDKKSVFCVQIAAMIQ